MSRSHPAPPASHAKELFESRHSRRVAQAGQPSSLFTALVRLVCEVEFDAALRATAAGLGASEWEAFVPQNVWDALQPAKDAIRAA